MLPGKRLAGGAGHPVSLRSSHLRVHTRVHHGLPETSCYYLMWRGSPCVTRCHRAFTCKTESQF